MKQVVTLIETPTGWLWAERGHAYSTLVQAVRAVGADARELAKAGRPVVTFITYEPQSGIGLLLSSMFAKGEMS